ncbi:MAG: TonB-dependent receptor, partial [Verrucomicrobia bacterium]|nr:TonB-dependent receptor [Verrucomicrobiota bacterium]
LLASARWDEHDSFDSKGTYSIQLAHQVEATNTQLFAKVATGYKAPSGQDFLFLDPSVDPNSLSPEESLSFEFGIRQALPNQIGNVSLVYFNTELENLIDSTGFPAFPTAVDTKMDGFEFGLDLTPVDGLTLYTNYTYLNAVITRGQYFDGFGGGPGDRLPRRPRHTLNAGVIYRTLDWKIGAEVRGGYDRLDGPNVILGDYTVARVYGSYYLRDNVELFARMENVFDQNYQTTTGYQARGFGAFGGVRFQF